MSQAIISGYLGLFNSALAAVIAAAGTKTGVINCGGMTLCGIKLPAAFTGTAITFEAAEASDGTFEAVKKSDGSSLSYTVGQGTYVAIDPKDFYGINFLKIVSNSTEGTARTLLCSLKGL